MTTPDSAIRERYDEVRDRIADAASRSGRIVDDITLVAVSKTFSSGDIEALHALGHSDFGENKVQELTDKAESLSGLDVRWHMIGHLQRNKAKDIIGPVTLFHALDSERLARKLHNRLEQEDAVMDCLIQVNISSENSKFGIPAGKLDSFMDKALAFDRLRILGLMTLASPVDDPEQVRPEFAAMRRLSEVVADRFHKRTGGPILSMGMSGDFEVAIEEGATHIRVGSAIFGERTYDE